MTQCQMVIFCVVKNVCQGFVRHGKEEACLPEEVVAYFLVLLINIIDPLQGGHSE